MPWQMRNVNLTRRAIAIELCEIVIVRRDDHRVRAHVISVIGTRGCAMEVRDPRSGEHVHYTNLFDVRRRSARLSLIHCIDVLSKHIGSSWGYPGIPGRHVQSL